MLTKYKPGIHNIQAEQFTRETEKSLYRGDVRFLRKNYYDTWQEAKDALIANAENSVEIIRRRLQYENGRLAQVRGLKKDQFIE